MHKFNPIFKSWLASKKNLNKNFKIIFADHGVIYGESDIFNYNQSLSSKYFINRKSVLQNEVSLPCLFLNKYKGNFKKKILLICRDTTKYPKNLFSGPICEEMNFQTQQVNKLLNNLSNRIKDNFFIRPYMAQRGWFNLKYYEKKLGQEKIIYSNNHYEKFKNKALIKIVTYPQTAFLESVVNGPTFLLFNPKHDFGRKENKEYMNILFKNKIAFKNGKELAVHLNEIENNILSWWQQKKIQKIVNLFVNNTNIFHDDPIPAWTKNIEKLLKFKY